MRKLWIMFLLILILSSQLLVFSSFHNTTVYNLNWSEGTSVITVAKYGYAGARIEISFSLTIEALNSTILPISITFANGTKLNIDSESYVFGFSLPRTGESYGSGTFSTSTGLTLSQYHPVSLMVSSNVTNVTGFEQTLLKSVPEGVQLYFIVVEGSYEVAMNAWSVNL